MTSVVRFRFVAGKGGVGKTTLAAARAVALAEAADARGESVLVVSTDPAHSLGDALLDPGTLPLTGEPRAVLPGLHGAELAAAPAYARWLGERRSAFQTLAERGTWLAAQDVARLLDLPVPGVDELIGLLELMRLAHLGRESGCARVVVDTAPTAHTLRLLAMPDALGRLAAVLEALQDRHRAVAEALAGRPWREDEADAVAAGLAEDARALGELIRDPARARFTWVLLPEALSLAESRDALAALAEAGVRVDEIVIDRVLPPPPGPCSACDARRRAEAEAIAEARRIAPPGATLYVVPEVDEEPRGAEALRALEALRTPLPDAEVAEVAEAAELPRPADAPAEPPPAAATPAPESSGPPPWLGAVAPPPLRLLMLGGKGGVGKTTCAAAIARLAAHERSERSARPERPERAVLLLSTDPAHSLGDVLETELSDDPTPIAGSPNLLARELDAPAAFARLEERYRDALGGLLSEPSRAGSKGADAPLDRAIVARLFEATPPGLDELVALAEIAELVETAEGEDDDRLVVVDTAPTGHALRLLELPAIALEWDHALLSILLEYRDAVGLPEGLAGELVGLSKRLKRLRSLLADPARCGFVVVTRPGELPGRETRRLVASLAGLEIAVPAVILNAVPDGTCARCRRRAEAALALARELPEVPAILTAPAEYPPPRGARALARWALRWRFRDPERR